MSLSLRVVPRLLWSQISLINRAHFGQEQIIFRREGITIQWTDGPKAVCHDLLLGGVGHCLIPRTCIGLLGLLRAFVDKVWSWCRKARGVRRGESWQVVGVCTRFQSALFDAVLISPPQ